MISICMKTRKHRPLLYNIEDIQKLLDGGCTWREVSDKLGISMGSMAKYKKRNLIKTRNKSEAIILSLKNRPPQKHTQEAKDKISLARKKFLTENPDKIPYLLNHKSKGASYPEMYFKECLKISNYVPEYRVGLYSLDFADIVNKIDFEVDGCQHRVDPRIVEHDIKRNINLVNLRWKIIRLNWSEFKKLKDLEKFDIVNSIKEQRIIKSNCLSYFGF